VQSYYQKKRNWLSSIKNFQSKRSLAVGFSRWLEEFAIASADNSGDGEAGSITRLAGEKVARKPACEPDYNSPTENNRRCSFIE
jgi:hypothetical protein